MISMHINQPVVMEEVLSRAEMEGIRGGAVVEIPGTDTSLPVVLPGTAGVGEEIQKIITGAATYAVGQYVVSHREEIYNAASYLVAETEDALCTFGRDVSGGCQVMWNWAKSYF